VGTAIDFLFLAVSRVNEKKETECAHASDNEARCRATLPRGSRHDITAIIQFSPSNVCWQRLSLCRTHYDVEIALTRFGGEVVSTQ
jgi:hypothetical protein